MEKCDIKNTQDEFVTYFKENDNFPEYECVDPKYSNVLIITRYLKELRGFDELDNKDDMYEFIDDLINHDKSYYINSLLRRFFDLFKGFYDKLYHDVCYSEAAYINSSVYGEAFYSIDKDFILNKKYKNEYLEYADMYDILLHIVPADYIDMIFEDFLYTMLYNSGLKYERTAKDKNIYYQISYSTRVKALAKAYLDEMISKLGEGDISDEPDLREYIKDKLKGYNEFVEEDKAKQLKRY